MTDRPSLFLITPPIAEVDAVRPKLAEACATGLVSVVLLRLAARDERALVTAVKALATVVQDRDVALLVADPGGEVDLATVVTRGGADGAHCDEARRISAFRERLADGRSLGAGGLLTKHDAMLAGEAGVDYVLFGEPPIDGAAPPFDLVEERAAWWAEIFQTPCVAYAPRLDLVPRLAATGADFVALGKAVWSDSRGPAAAIAAAHAALRVIAPEPVT